jgi:hypothetical protein
MKGLFTAVATCLVVKVLWNTCNEIIRSLLKVVASYCYSAVEDKLRHVSVHEKDQNCCRVQK